MWLYTNIHFIRLISISTEIPAILIKNIQFYFIQLVDPALDSFWNFRAAKPQIIGTAQFSVCSPKFLDEKIHMVELCYEL